jgi:hypothetical protein
MKTTLFIISCVILLSGCVATRSSFDPARKYSPDQLQKDFILYRNVLETHHPALYWYTPKDSMDYYFERGMEQLKDSLTEPGFRKVLNYVTAKINCGHTTVRSSKAWNRHADTSLLGKIFPLSMKIWDEAMVVTTNLNRRDSILKRGTVITKINGQTKDQLVDTMFEYISTDGYNRTNKYQSLSNRGFFGAMYTSLYGLQDKYRVEYLDNAGEPKQLTIPVFNPAVDTAGRTGTRSFRPASRPSRRQRRELQQNAVRLLKIDTVNHTAMMDLASFSRGYELKRFFRNSFQALADNRITHLIIDVRSNGGGSVTNSTLATRFIADHRFRIADSLYAVRKGSRYDGHIQNHFWNKLFITMFCGRKKDGYYHFGYFERHYFKPKKKNHFDGKVYILTGGNSFSATTLFTSVLIRQENVTVVGEETGGGAYGNSAWLIPDVTLPETRVRFRLPLFRLVIDKTVPRNGRGVQPEVPSLPTVDAIKRNVDFKLEKAMELIRLDKLIDDN